MTDPVVVDDITDAYMRGQAHARTGLHPAGLIVFGPDTMPCDSAWPAAKVDVFNRWADSGTQP
ncbi:MAG TPA: hypothetical protein VGS19_02375 [Streptosporangiaceae bacterium]|nr:hypothetical protein [Streptosporangiaceae bacterium]